MDLRHVAKLSSATHFHQIIRMLKFSRLMELSLVQRPKFSVLEATELMDQIKLRAQRPDNGVAQFQAALKMILQQFAYRRPLCQQQLSLERDHPSHQERHQHPCERAVASRQHPQQRRSQFQFFRQSTWIRKKIKMTAIYFLAQCARNIQEEDQLSPYQRITIILRHLQQRQQLQHANLKRQRKIFRKKLMPHIQETMKLRELTIMCKLR